MATAKVYQFPDYEAIVDGSSVGIVYNGLEWFRLPIAIAVGVNDKDVALEAESESESDGEYTLTFRTISSRWLSKVYTLFLAPDGASLKVSVSGAQPTEHGRSITVDEVTFCPETKYEASGYTLPIAAHASRRRMYREVYEEENISISYLAPPMYAFPFVAEKAAGSVAIGIAAKEGEYNFNELRYRTRMFRNRCGFVLPYPKARVVGDGDTWETPALLVTFGGDEIAALAAYSSWHYNRMGCRTNPARQNAPSWWNGPFFCGWSEQVAQAKALGMNLTAYEAARQDVYEAMSRRLDELGLNPAVIIIDDKWQENYGTLVPDKKKWPDLRGFVDAQHAKGRKVMLWFKLWSGEGLPTDECAVLWHNPQHADPTNPAYAKHLREAIYRLLSPDEGCYDCDGFKVDFMSCISPNPAIKTYENDVYGVELHKRILSLIYSATKAAKPDAIVNCSACHPYFSEVVDQSRLHDLVSTVRNSASCMEWRRDLFRAAMPDALIDTDEGGRGSRLEVLSYMRKAPELGAPALYWLTPSADAPCPPEDWAERKVLWDAYLAEQQK